MPADAIGYGLPLKTGHDENWAHRVAEPHKELVQPMNFGADINTLIQLLEAGKL